MLEKIGHIKNPLTVIAMFAGIAEVSGAAVLPFIDTSIQERYVCFLMGFPCLLVALFFITLWCKHFVLYAPSDFKEDQNFMDAHFKRGSSSLPVGGVDLFPQDSVTPALDEKAKGSTSNGEACGEEELATGESKKDEAKKPGQNDITIEGSYESEPVVGSNVAQKQKAESFIIKKKFNLGFIARNRVIRGLVHKLGGNCQLNVEPKQLPNIKFDAVIESSVICVVSLVDVSEDNLELGRKINKKFSDAKMFWQTLSSIDKNRFVFHLGLMFAPGTTRITDTSISDLVSKRAELPFKTEVVLYEYNSHSLNSYPF